MIEATVVRVIAEETFMLTVELVLMWGVDYSEVVLVLCRRLPEGETWWKSKMGRCLKVDALKS